MREHGVLRVVGGALVLAVAALTEMSLLTWSFYKVPFAPQNAHDWREIYSYGGIIAASYVIGALIRALIRYWLVGRGRMRPRRHSGMTYRMLRALGEFDADRLERVEKAIRHFEYTAINLGALCASVYFLIEHVHQMLDYIPTIGR
jgi:hypothetical protein